MNIIGVDIGFSSCKVTLGNEYGEISKKFKFSSLIGITKKIDAVENSKIKKYDDNYYMVGDDAQHLPSANMIDITEYKNLEYYAPLLLQHAIEKCGVEPDIVVTGLSIAQIGNSGYFQAQLEKYTIDDKEHIHNTVYVLPQGAGAKLTVDRYGARFPEEQKEFNGNKNYIICDIGFNTIDYTKFSDNGIAMTIILMLIGGGSGSTAGGIKMTTIFILVATMCSVLKQDKEVAVFKKRIEPDIIKNAVAVFALDIFLFIVGSMIISGIEGFSLKETMFECASAVATVGLTLGITPHLGIISKVLLI